MHFDGAIFDLDNTLYAARTIPRSVVAPALRAVEAANTGPTAVPAASLAAALEACWSEPFDVVAERFALPAPLRAAWRQAHAALEVVGGLTPYEDVWRLTRLPVTRLLVTTGFRRFQESKVAALGIAPLFEAVWIDALDGTGPRLGKAGLFRRIQRAYGWEADRVLVVGDSEASEIAAGNALGMYTVQVLRPEIVPAPTARRRIRDLDELRALVTGGDHGTAP